MERSLLVTFTWKAAAFLGSVFGALVSAAIMYFAWQHNAQGEIHGEGNIEWGYWLQIGASWFLVSAIVCSTLLGVLFAVVRKVVGRRVGSGTEK
jgi:hypothetical protein